MSFSAVILAGGMGKRTKFPLAKVMLPLAGQPLISHIVSASQATRPNQTIIVSRPDLVNNLNKNFPNAQIAIQKKALGTANALASAKHLITSDYVLVLLGDCPLVTTELIDKVTAPMQGNIRVVAFDTDHPTGYGRILKAGEFVSEIIEEKDATEEQKAIRCVNSGIFYIRSTFLFDMLDKITNKNSQEEYYLTDLVKFSDQSELVIASQEELLGVNTLEDLAAAERLIQSRMIKELLNQGVLITDPQRLTLQGKVNIAPGVIIEPNVIIKNSEIGSGSHIGANSSIIDSEIANDVVILDGCVINQSCIQSGCQIGPMAHLREKVNLDKNVNIGNFVEIKASKLGGNTKAKHLSYIGNGEIGESVNIGAGTIFCNYDGKQKYQTIIHDGAFIGSNSALIAPVSIGADSLVAAGSTITDSVAHQQTAFARARQVNKANKNADIES